MAFCSYCGKPLGVNDQCDCEQSKASDLRTSAAPVSPPPQDSPKPNAEASPNISLPITFMPTVIKILKDFFSLHTDDSLTHAANSKDKIFAFFVGIYCLLYGLIFMLMPRNLINKAVESVNSLLWGYTSSSALSLLPLGKLFFSGIILGLVTYFAYVLLIKLLHLIYKQDVSFVTIMNTVAVAHLPITTALLCCVLFSFFSAMLCVILLLAGSAMTIMMLYIGIRKDLKLSITPLWFYTALHAIVMLIVFLCLKVVAGDVVSSLASLFLQNF